MSAKKPEIADTKNKLTAESHTCPPLNNSLSKSQEVTEQIFSGDKLVDYEELLSSLEEEYSFEDLSQHEDPDEVRINHRVQGSGSQWESVLQIEVDETQSYIDWIKDSLDSIKRNLTYPNQDCSSSDLHRQKTHIHSYPSNDISVYELESFVDSFLEQ